MADYPSLNRSPFFKSFAKAHRVGGIVQKNQRLMQQSTNRSTNNMDMAESGNLQHYTMPPIRQVTYPMPQDTVSQAIPPMLQGAMPQNMPAMPHNLMAQPMLHGPHNAIPQPMPPRPHNAMPQPMPPRPHNAMPQSMPHGPHNIMPQNPMPQHTPTMQPIGQPDPASSMPAPPSPQNAAERFQTINRGLPDGVRFEPLDDETKAALKKLGLSGPAPKPADSPPAQPQPKTQPQPLPAQPQPKTQPQSPPARPQPNIQPQSPPDQQQSKTQPQPPSESFAALPEHPPESIALLERLIQNERNAAVYYQYLSEIAPVNEFKDALQEITRDCENRRGQFSEILKNLNGQEFEPKNTPINTAVEFNQGVDIAFMEERKVLEAMAELIDKFGSSEEKNAYIMQNMLNKRMIRLNWLQWLRLKHLF